MNYPMILSGVLVCAILGGCQTTGANRRADVYQANEVNTVQQAKTVKILAVLPAKVEVDNRQNKQAAQVAGVVLGALIGGLAGHSMGNHSSTNAALGATGGAALGGAAGSMASDTALVDGVSIAFEDVGGTFSSAQVGRVCEFAPGLAIMISTSPTETRIQPNATCPVEKTN